MSLLPVAVAAAPVNQLVNHPSPYLALHGSDPVAWQEWNAATVARARRENKLLFVSVGYFACHWCHVMQRESYKNAQIAALLNRDFIPVKVDRELNSGLDDALQTFSRVDSGVAGRVMRSGRAVSPRPERGLECVFRHAGHARAAQRIF